MLLGADVSKWQKLMDWQVCADAGAQFAFIRAGSINNVSGICYTDDMFERNAELAPDFMPIGFYWYFRPNHDPIKQANYFCDLIRAKDYRMPPVIDLETSGGMSPSQVTNRAGLFVLRINELLGELPFLYSRAYWLNENTIADEFMKMLELWIARYTSKGKPWGNLLPWPDAPGYKPRDYDTWKFWQWSADGNGRGAEFGAQSNSIDLDYFNGDEAEFKKYIGEELQPELPISIGVKVDIDGVKYRGHIEKVE